METGAKVRSVFARYAGITGTVLSSSAQFSRVEWSDGRIAAERNVDILPVRAMFYPFTVPVTV